MILATFCLNLMLGQVEKDALEAVKEMMQGIIRFQSKKPDSQPETITLIVCNDPDTEEALRSALD